MAKLKAAYDPIARLAELDQTKLSESVDRIAAGCVPVDNSKGDHWEQAARSWLKTIIRAEIAKKSKVKV